jgi:hypothetical protein
MFCEIDLVRNLELEELEAPHRPGADVYLKRRSRGPGNVTIQGLIYPCPSKLKSRQENDFMKMYVYAKMIFLANK